MIDLYYCPTPNCQKVSIALEELELPYQVHAIDIVAGDQNDPAYAAVCPNRKVPAIVDPDGPEGAPLVLWESGASAARSTVYRACRLPMPCRRLFARSPEQRALRIPRNPNPPMTRRAVLGSGVTTTLSIVTEWSEGNEPSMSNRTQSTPSQFKA